MIETVKYTLKIWLTAVVISSLVVSIVFNSSSFSNLIELFFLITVCALIFSFATWIIFCLGVYLILKQNTTAKGQKVAILLLSIILALATTGFVLTGFESSAFKDGSFLVFAAPYIVCLAAGIHFYNLPNLYIDHQENSTTC